MSDPSDNDLVNPYQSPQADLMTDADERPPAETSCRREKFRMLLWMLIVFAINGFVAGTLPERSPAARIVEWLTLIAFIILLLQWCSYDRSERWLQPWPGFALMMIFCPGPLIIMPTYFFVTRGTGGFAATGKAAAFFVLLLAVAFVAAIGGAMASYLADLVWWQGM